MGATALVAHGRDQQMLDADVAVASPHRLAQRLLEHRPSVRRDALWPFRNSIRACADQRDLSVRPRGRQVDSELAERLGSAALHGGRGEGGVGSTLAKRREAA
jgi:hypothetical protein